MVLQKETEIDHPLQGQIAFFLRRNPRSDGGSPFAGYVMCATMQHLNSMAQAGWARARRKLQAGHQVAILSWLW